jgi:hypothetical protein
MRESAFAYASHRREQRLGIPVSPLRTLGLPGAVLRRETIDGLGYSRRLGLGPRDYRRAFADRHLHGRLQQPAPQIDANRAEAVRSGCSRKLGQGAHSLETYRPDAATARAEKRVIALTFAHDVEALCLHVTNAQWLGLGPEADSLGNDPASSLDRRFVMTATTTAEATAAEPNTFSKSTSICASITT